MLRLSSSTYSSICLLVFLNFVWLLFLTTTTASARPAESAPGNGMRHVTSFVSQNKNNYPRQEFDFEQNEAETSNSVKVQQLFLGLLKLPEKANASVDLSFDTDDDPATERITLDDDLELMAIGEQHEGSTEAPDTWNRIKLAIPVLEPVRHLLATVGGGGVNNTHVETNRHRLVGHEGVHHPHVSGNASSSAIETEEDRETAIDSTGFDVLETLGTAGTVVWGILQNLRKLFAASAGNASSVSSGGGGGGGAN
ncbi:hypothetical protein KR074_004854 [Drosophila pseudoananassae]|nr:hypothetical protein KR074_004854 [Drosophila pseudoananassae]